MYMYMKIGVIDNVYQSLTSCEVVKFLDIPIFMLSVYIKIKSKLGLWLICSECMHKVTKDTIARSRCDSEMWDECFMCECVA